MKKLLLITYYWPPSGGAGVQRCLKHVKYFRDFGWEPVVFTAEDAAYPILDESLTKDIPEGIEVVKGPIWEPYELYKRFTGQKKKERVYSGFLSEDKKPSFTQRASVWIRGNFFIPDARKFWISPSVKLLTKYLKENPVDAIISSGPPHSVHMIARGVRRNTGIPWLADFRDPWTNIDFYDQLMLTSWADKAHHRMEKSVIDEADKMVTVSWKWAEEYKEMGRKDIQVITNGFDDADFQFGEVALDEKFSFNHIGYLNTDRNPPALWKAFGELCQEIPAMKEALVLRFIGKTDQLTFAQLEEQGLMEVVEKVDYMPHNEVVKTLAQSQILLLLINNTPNVLGVIPGKIFEYLASGRPVMGVGNPEGDSARILRETEAGKMIDFDNGEELKREILRLYQLYKKKKLTVNKGNIARFTRKHSAGLMAGLLDQMV
ncbi:MAG: glycosyltransferase [Bacteroidota bacterium]